MTSALVLGLGLVLVVEGLAWVLAPSLIERMLEALRALPLDRRRLVGLAALALGTGLIWLSKLLGG